RCLSRAADSARSDDTRRAPGGSSRPGDCGPDGGERRLPRDALLLEPSTTLGANTVETRALVGREVRWLAQDRAGLDVPQVAMCRERLLVHEDARHAGVPAPEVVQDREPVGVDVSPVDERACGDPRDIAEPRQGVARAVDGNGATERWVVA